MFPSRFGFRSLTGTSMIAVASLVLGVAAAGLAASLSIAMPSARTSSHRADVPETNLVTSAVRFGSTSLPSGDVQIGPISYQIGDASYRARHAPDARRAQGKITAPACVEGWRELENGPVGRRVLVTCPGATQGVAGAGSSRVEPKTEHLRAPAAVHGRLIRAYSVPLDLPQAGPVQNP
jgi:hypothetical protein